MTAEKRPYNHHLENLSARDNVLRLPEGLRGALSEISAVCLDVDGVLTDGSRVLSEQGRAFISFNARDGLGILLLQKCGIEVMFVSAIESPIVEMRARELEVRKVWLGVTDKLAWVQRTRLSSRDKFLFVGDDIWDIAAMKECNLAASVHNAIPEALAVADLVSACSGGLGAVRQIADVILEVKGIDRERLAAQL